MLVIIIKCIVCYVYKNITRVNIFTSIYPHIRKCILYILVLSTFRITIWVGQLISTLWMLGNPTLCQTHHQQLILVGMNENNVDDDVMLPYTFKKPDAVKMRERERRHIHIIHNSCNYIHVMFEYITFLLLIAWISFHDGENWKKVQQKVNLDVWFSTKLKGEKQQSGLNMCARCALHTNLIITNKEL